MKVLIIVAHYREQSLTYQLKDQFEKGLREAGHEVDVLDLYKLKLNPILEREDDPVRGEEVQHFSKEVLREQERLETYEAIVFIYPMYWFSLPAMLKGYIDRVFNYGFAYGRYQRWFAKKMLWMPLTGSTEENFVARKMDTLVEGTLVKGISGYIGAERAKIHFFYDTYSAGKEEIRTKLFNEAYQQGLDFDKW